MNDCKHEVWEVRDRAADDPCICCEIERLTAEATLLKNATADLHAREVILSAESRGLAESLLEALEWNWLDKDFNEAMFDTFTAQAKKVLEPDADEQLPNMEEATPDRKCCGFHKDGGDTYAKCWEPDARCVEHDVFDCPACDGEEQTDE